MAAHFARGYLRSKGYLVDESFDNRTVTTAAIFDDSPNWNVQSWKYAFPDLTFDGFETRIANQFANEAGIAIEAAFGLSDPLTLAELKRLAIGGLMIVLTDKTDGAMTWHPKMKTSEYWELFQREFPALADSLLNNFHGAFVTSTIVEQNFTIVGIQAHPNSSTTTTQNNFNYAATKGFQGRSMRVKMQQEQASNSCSNGSSNSNSSAITKVAIRMFRDKCTIQEYVKRLYEVEEQLKIVMTRMETDDLEVRAFRAKTVGHLISTNEQMQTSWDAAA